MFYCSFTVAHKLLSSFAITLLASPATLSPIIYLVKGNLIYERFLRLTNGTLTFCSSRANRLDSRASLSCCENKCLPIYDLRLFCASGKKETLNCKNYNVMFAILLKYLEVVRHSDSASRVFAIVSVVVVSIQNHSSIPTLSINQSYLVA